MIIGDSSALWGWRYPLASREGDEYIPSIYLEEPSIDDPRNDAAADDDDDDAQRCSEDPPFGGSPDGVFNFPKTCKEKTSCLINVDRIRPK
jgi:hypothetical protein